MKNSILDVRLNTLNEFVDYFVIVESSFTHKGDPRKLKFNHKKFEKFKDKIIYLLMTKIIPANLRNKTLIDNDFFQKKSWKIHLMNV